MEKEADGAKGRYDTMKLIKKLESGPLFRPCQESVK